MDSARASSHGGTRYQQDTSRRANTFVKNGRSDPLLDETAKANAIKGVAGMRSYFIGSIQ